MSNKNSHYKLDFKVKSVISGNNLGMKEFRRRWYWRGNTYDVVASSEILQSYVAKNNLKGLIPADFNIDAAASKPNVELTANEKTQFLRYIEIGREVWCNELHSVWGDFSKMKATYGAGVTSQSPEKFDAILAYLATQTPEFKKYEAAFETWLKKRPGVFDIWEKHREEHNLVETLDVITFARIANDRDFRNLLENARPRILKIGTLVQLKDTLKNNRNKDPFYWTEYKESPRLGMISKLYENNAFGYGSRQLRIMWIANSEETTLMERDLKILSE
jgi:hypothetical protein